MVNFKEILIGTINL